MVGKYVFAIGRLQTDLRKHLDSSSTRQFARNTNGALSASTVHRISVGKVQKVGIDDIMTICSVIGTNPHDYIDRMMF